jgi:hypothetical protein
MASKVRYGRLPVILIATCAFVGTAGAQARRAGPKPEDLEAIKTLAVEIRQRDSAERRTAAVANAREMLKGDARAQATALAALAMAADVKFDRAGLEEAVAGLLASPSADVRAAALRTLPTVDPKPSRIEDEAKLAGDPDPQVRARVMQSIVFTRRANHIETPVEEPALTLLGDQNPDVVRETARGLWGVPLTPQLEAKVIELSRFPEGKVPSFSSMQYDMMYYVLSTRPVLGKAVAQRLWEIARNPLLDRNWTGRAVWGLAHESSPEAADVVTKALVEELDNSLVAYEREWAVRGLAMVKTPAARTKLEEVAAKDDSQELRKLAKGVTGDQ